MRLILTGAAGFIGSCFLWKLNTLGIDDVIVVDTTSALENNPNLARKKFSDSLSREDLIKKLDQLKEVNAIVHLGACADTTERDEKFLAQNNTEYSKTLARWALGNNVAFHYASSASVYGDGKNGYSDDDAALSRYTPLNLYAWSKYKFDQWLIQEKLTSRVVGYRYFNVFGPNEYHKGEMKSMVAKAYHQIRETGRAKLFASSRPGYSDGSEQRDFVYVKDVCNAMVHFLENPGKHGIFNLGTGEARSFQELILAVYSAMEQPPNIEYIPMPEKLKRQYQYYTCADMSKMSKITDNHLFSRLEVSVADYVQSHLSQSNPYL